MKYIPACLELQRKWDKTRERFEGVAKTFFDVTKVS